jgi:hypothetical protein
MANEKWEFTDEELKQLETNTFGSGPGAEKSLDTAKRLFEENAVDAALAIIRVCKQGSTDRIRFDAAKYITERALGPVAKETLPPLDDELLKFYKQIAGVGE